jgi:hypothetical protein
MDRHQVDLAEMHAYRDVSSKAGMTVVALLKAVELAEAIG